MLSFGTTRRTRAALLLVIAGAARADVYDCNWYTFDCGGGTSASAAYTVAGTMGQPDAGTMAGGTYSLQGGFWVAAAAPAPCNGFNPCDTNCDGSLNGFDIGGFVDALNGSGSTCSPCSSDANGDGSVNGFDIAPFVDCLGGG